MTDYFYVGKRWMRGETGQTKITELEEPIDHGLNQLPITTVREDDQSV